MLVWRLEIVRHALLEIVMAVVAMHAAGLFGMGVDIDRHESPLPRESYSRRLPRHRSGCSFALLWWNSGE
jgi:hypothetical protein